MKRLFPICALIVLCLIYKPLYACGHDGFFLGVGYQQLVLYTTEDRLRAVGSKPEKITFGPGFGANLLAGYDFKGTRWGLQMPFEYSNFRLNRNERVNYFGIATEGIFHIVAWENGVDLSLVGGVGASILPEGQIENNTGAAGINFGLGPAFNYFYAQGKIKGSLYVQVPVRAIIFFGDNLSRNKTTVLAVPIRLGLSIGF